MPIMAILVLGKCSANFGRQILGKRLQKSLPECCFTLDTDFDWLRRKNKPRMANFPIENIAHERCNVLSHQCDQTFSVVITKRCAEILPNWIFFYQTHANSAF